MRSRPRLMIRCVTLAVTVALLPAAAHAQGGSGNDGFNVTPTGYVQLDFRGFSNWDVTPGTGRLNRDSVEIRRLRAGLDGQWKRMTFEVSIDPLDDDGVFVKDAYGQVRFSRALRLTVGQFKVPGTRDYDETARRLDFPERAALTLALGVGRDLGARFDGRVGRVNYEAGFFAGDGVGRNDRSGMTGASRVVWRVAKDLEIGGSISAGRTEATDTDSQNGVSLRAPSGYRFADAVYVNGRRTRLGADAEWTPGGWRVKAEWLRETDQRKEQGLDYEDLPAAIGTGFYSSVRRRLTRRIDAAFRYDYLALDDANGTTAFESVRPRATDIRARANHAYTAAGAWTVNRWIRLIGDVSAERYTDGRSAPRSGDEGAYFTAAARIQIELP